MNCEARRKKSRKRQSRDGLKEEMRCRDTMFCLFSPHLLRLCLCLTGGRRRSAHLHTHLSSVENQIRDLDAQFTSEYHATEHASDDTVPKMVKLQADMSAVKGQLSGMQQQIERLAETVTDALRAAPAPAPAPAPRVSRRPTGSSLTYAHRPNASVQLARQERL